MSVVPLDRLCKPSNAQLWAMEDSMDWSNVTRAEIISTISAFVAVLSATYTWRNFRISARKERRELEATRPIFQIRKIWLEAQHAPWYGTGILITNRYPHSLYVTGFRLKSPNAGGIGCLVEVPGPTVNDRSTTKMVEFPGKWFEPRPSKQEIGAATGTANVGMFTVWLRPFDDLERDYSLEIELEERLEEVRRWTKVVKVAVPELKAEAISETRSDPAT